MSTPREHTTHSRGTETSPQTDGTRAPFTLPTHPVENHRPLRVIVIGSGYSGIYMGIRIPQRLRNVALTIYEKNNGLGGTWWENRYPGCACDIPSHSYQYSFEPNVEWSALYAPAQEIQAYLSRTAAKFGAYRFIKLGKSVVGCNWDAPKGEWVVKVRDVATGSVEEDRAEVLVSARGALNAIAWPEIEGLDSFQGETMHSAAWNSQYDFTNKRVGVIGSGSSSIQIVPQLQKLPGVNLSCFVRSKTWISPPFGQAMWDTLGFTGTDIPEDMKAKFRSDPEAYYKFRLAIEEDGNSIHAFTILGTEFNLGAKQFFGESMRARLASRPDIAEFLVPSFSPGCRRLTPGPGYLEALTQPNVTFVTQEIAKVDPRGVVTKDGTLHELDVLVCATGFHVSAPPPFPVVGSGGRTLVDHWSERATSYLGVTTDGFPNMFMMLGPNSAIGTGSLTMMIESAGDYIVRCVRKIQRDNIRSMAPNADRVRDFTEYVDEYFKGTVYLDGCRSWYKNGKGQVTGLWPGSTLHCIESLRSTRWEDYDYEYVGEDGGKRVNRLAWLGDGWSLKQREGKDLAFYLYPEFVDKPNEGKPEEGERERIRPFAF
ncbi:FAD/NAD(P)-binding domain-containing protein [Gonapodya prolifera JEL478]|uniref:FAD/NAD(P)-binding domain-containing protein n=1 Tax=Gonapodya prolifera (strain JEL478) TaxID=1344416 RepID=A0A139AXL4_GONPJ|nr:FAD/NAD(P)-binding domain-containing protein [Gonapodya prolifera JEL478]|eukprot:KXS21491.1 FAD/NAD(P)-binding domain-containing protein [Gonapodya prolifera JEL478]